MMAFLLCVGQDGGTTGVYGNNHVGNPDCHDSRLDD